MKHFEIWYAELPLIPDFHITGGNRPVIIVSNDQANRFSPAICVVPLTTKNKKRHLPTHVPIRGQGLAQASQALCENIITLDRHCLKRKLGEISNPHDQKAIQKALAIQLNIEIKQMANGAIYNSIKNIVSKRSFPRNLFPLHQYCNKRGSNSSPKTA